MSRKLPNRILLMVVGAIGTILLAAAHSHLSQSQHISQVHAQGADAAFKPGPSSPLNELLQRSILCLEGRRSVATRVRQSVDLLGKQLVGSGQYLELHSEDGVMFRFEMRLQLEGQMNSLLEVSDGRYLWTYRKDCADQSLTCLDLTRIAQAMEEAGRLRDTGSLEQWPGTGGIARMLAGIDAAFEFHAAEEMRIGQQVRVVKLEGRWKGDRLAKILPDQQAAIEQGRGVDLSKLPEHLPDRVVLFLGVEDLFPYRIEYRRRESLPSDNGRPLDRLLVGIDFFEVSFNLPIDPNRFVYSPGNMSYSNATDDLLKAMGLKP